MTVIELSSQSVIATNVHYLYNWFKKFPPFKEKKRMQRFLEEWLYVAAQLEVMVIWMKHERHRLKRIWEIEEVFLGRGLVDKKVKNRLKDHLRPLDYKEPLVDWIPEPGAPEPEELKPETEEKENDKNIEQETVPIQKE